MAFLRAVRAVPLAMTAMLARPIAAASGATSLFDLSAKSLDGSENIALSRFKGQVALVVNVACE